MNPRRTRQLSAIYEVVSAAHDHPTAEEVCARVRRRLPRISLGTVYRNLQKLAAQHQVRVVHLADRPARYDPMVQDHDHFLCEQCGRVADLERMAEAVPNCAHLNKVGYRVRAHAVTLYGLCPTCGRSAKRRPAAERPAGRHA